MGRDFNSNSSALFLNNRTVYYYYSFDVIAYREAESLLEVYSLRELLDYNQVDEAEALSFMVKEGFLELPEPKPL